MSERSALLIDFGGVLTTSVHDAFRAFSTEISGDPELVLRLLFGDTESSRLLVENSACERLGTAPGDSVMVDDIECNLAGAARLGIAGVLHRSAARTVRELDERFGIRAAQWTTPPADPGYGYVVVSCVGEPWDPSAGGRFARGDETARA